MGFLRTAETRWAPVLRRAHRLAKHCDIRALEQATGHPVPRWAARCVADPDAVQQAPEPYGLDARAPAVAHVNWGRWIAHCPSCGAAQEVSHRDPRLYCPLCLNAAAAGAFVHVVFPHEIMVAAIEDLLGRRPDRRTRNWRPGESVEQLQRENLAHAAELLPHPVLA